MSWWGGKRNDVDVRNDRDYGQIDDDEDEGDQDRVCLSVADLIEENAQLRLLYAATAAGASTKSASTSIPSLEVTPSANVESDSMDSDGDGSGDGESDAYHTADSNSNSAIADAKGKECLVERGASTNANTKWRRRARDMSCALSLSEKRLGAERAKKQALAKRLQDLEEAISVQSQAGKLVDKELRSAEQEVLKLKTQVLAGIPCQMQLRDALQREQKSEALCQSQASRLEAAARQRAAESARVAALNEKLFAAQEAKSSAQLGWEQCRKRIGDLEAELAASETSAEHAMVCIALAEDALKKSEGRVRELEASQLCALQKLCHAEQEVERFRRQWAEMERQRTLSEVNSAGSHAKLAKLNDPARRFDLVDQKRVGDAHVSQADDGPMSAQAWNLSLACLPFASMTCTGEEEEGGSAKRLM
jgi:chromosome segregation ATPase